MTGVTNEHTVGLPSLSARRKATWDYYRIEFLEDGYPGRRHSDGELYPHPLYGPYAINDYLGRYTYTGDRTYLDAACRVSEAAIARMDAFSGALVFRYQPKTGVSTMPEAFYSGLTQGRYLATLGRLDAATGGHRFRNACEAILQSLTFPADAGGVARRTPSGGLLIEEYSHSIPDYTLNGWTTATTLVHEYAETANSDTARQVFHDSVRGIADVLPMYDVPELANSRYRLSGQAKIRLSFQHPGTRIRSASIRIPGAGDHPVQHVGTRKWSNQWVSGVDEDGHLKSTTAGMDVVLCRLSWPRPNIVRLELESPRGGKVAAKIGTGHYDPLTTAIRHTDWAVVHTEELTAGHQVLEFPIPWHLAELIAYPTNFAKVVAGKNYNWYHFIHIDTLRRLTAITGDPMLDYFCHRWAAYPSQWPRIPAYAEAGIVLERYRNAVVE